MQPITAGLIILMLGMGTVFAALAIYQIFIQLTHRLDVRLAARVQTAAGKAVDAAPPAAAPAPSGQEAPTTAPGVSTVAPESAASLETPVPAADVAMAGDDAPHPPAAETILAREQETRQGPSAKGRPHPRRAEDNPCEKKRLAPASTNPPRLATRPVAAKPAASSVRTAAPTATAPVVSASPPASASHGNDGVRPIASSMQGVITKVLVKVGDAVVRGQKVAILEAMKMDNDVLSPAAGTVAEVKVAAGEVVTSGQPVVMIRS